MLGKMLWRKIRRRHLSGLGYIFCSILLLAVVCRPLWASFDWSMEFCVTGNGCAQHIRSVPALSDESCPGFHLWSRSVVVGSIRADSTMFTGQFLTGVAILLAADQS